MTKLQHQQLAKPTGKTVSKLIIARQVASGHSRAQRGMASWYKVAQVRTEAAGCQCYKALALSYEATFVIK